jgi:hypothetical protein
MSGIFDQVINYSPPSLLTGTVTYKGTWSAATNTPTLTNPPSAITNGNYYVVSAAGTQFSLVFNIGDWIISNGTAWEKVDNTDAVSSVFGRTGAVVGVSTDYSVVGITNTALGASNPSTVAATTITASSTIAATGAVTGSNLSGTNTGNQTITLTGGVTGSGTGSFAATVVTNANLTGVITSSGNATSIASQTGTGSTFVVSGSPTITTPVIAQINDASSNETLKLASIASAVNEVTIENAATGNAVHISATGGDASVGLHLAGKGASGYVNVQDSTDATKRIMFNASGGTTNTRTMLSSTQTVDRTLSLPDATDTLVGKATTDTLTNKTITGGILNGTLGATTPSTIAATTISSTTGANFATSSGSVGIGTASPAFKTEIQQAVAGTAPSLRLTPQLVLKGYNGNASFHSGIGFSMNEHTNGYWGSGILEVDDSGSYGAALAFYTSTGAALASPSEAMRISSSGTVGIGKTSPNGTLQVSTGTNFTSILKVSDTSSGGTGFILLGDGNSTDKAVGIWRADANSVSTGGSFLNIGGYGGIVFAASNALFGSQTERMRISTAGVVSITGTLTATSTISDATGDVRILVQNSQSAAYTLVLADSGKHILHPSADTTARTFTIPANGTVAFTIGTAVTFINQNAGGVITISITTDTMRLAGAGTTGSRSLAANGVATAVKITSTEWIISGTGLT